MQPNDSKKIIPSEACLGLDLGDDNLSIETNDGLEAKNVDIEINEVQDGGKVINTVRLIYHTKKGEVRIHTDLEELERIIATVKQLGVDFWNQIQKEMKH